MDKVVYKKESYEIVGCCFEVFNQIGPGHKEKTYQRALEVLFKDKNIKYQSQFSVPIKIKDNQIGRYYFDFLINRKIILS